MHMHTDTLTAEAIRAALTAERNAGRIAGTVHFDTLTEHRSNTHARGFEIKLGAYSKAPGDGRRWGNSGGYGATSRTTGDYTATHDEWGFLLAALFAADPALVVGSVARPIYSDRGHFDHLTGLTYAPARLAALIEADGDPYPYRSGRKLAGRYGAGRHDGDDLPGYVVRAADEGRASWVTLDPRSAADVRAFGHLAAVSA